MPPILKAKLLLCLSNFRQTILITRVLQYRRLLACTVRISTWSERETQRGCTLVANQPGCPLLSVVKPEQKGKGKANNGFWESPSVGTFGGVPI